MEQKTVWQQGSGNPENPNYLAAIREWWVNLSPENLKQLIRELTK